MPQLYFVKANPLYVLLEKYIINKKNPDDKNKLQELLITKNLAK